MTTTKFKKVRLFKLVRELNVSLETLKEHLEETGYADALTGAGINAAIQDEAAYNELLNAFADDMETAARVHKKRARQTTSEEQPSRPEPETVDSAEEAPEVVAAGDGVGAPIVEEEPLLAESVEAEQEKVPEDGVVAEGVVAAEEIVESDEDSEEAIAEKEPVEAEEEPASVSQEISTTDLPGSGRGVGNDGRIRHGSARRRGYRRGGAG